MLNDIIYMSIKPQVASTRPDEVDSEFKKGVGRAIESAMQNRLDPGLKFRGGVNSGVKVELQDTGKITVRRKTPAKDVTKPARDRAAGRPVMDRFDTVNDLFIPSNGVPSMVRGADGRMRVAFRTVRDKDLFSREQDIQDKQVKQIIDNAVQTSVVDAMEDGIKSVERRYPSDVIGSEDIAGGDM